MAGYYSSALCPKPSPIFGQDLLLFLGLFTIVSRLHPVASGNEACVRHESGERQRRIGGLNEGKGVGSGLCNRRGLEQHAPTCVIFNEILDLRGCDLHFSDHADQLDLGGKKKERGKQDKYLEGKERSKSAHDGE